MSIEIAPLQSRLRLPSPASYRSSSPRLRLPPPPPPSFSYTLQKLPPLSQDSQLVGNGLKTPPWEDMSAASQPASEPLPCDIQPLPSYPIAVSLTSRLRADSTSRSESRLGFQRDRGSQQQQQQQQHDQPAPVLSVQSRAGIPPTSQPCFPSCDSSVTRLSPRTASTSLSCPSDATTGAKKIDESLIYHSLRIPKCISPHGGHLPDFAAQMTCLFWFVSFDELKAAESMRPRPSHAPFPRLPDLAKPHDQFRKWVSNVLSTTQVTQNVILLALLFIYRLKMSTPQIMGRAGSEYRLLTIALMLGNKFLDDNTYTNKTWAEVSSFAVQEIHVMEVEFLSNMRYNLSASSEEWEGWLDKLARFHQHYEWATKTPPSPAYISSPSPRDFTSPMQSPSSMPLPAPDLQSYTPYTPGGTMQPTPDASRYSREWVAQDAPSPPLAPRPSSLKNFFSRKRSPDTDLAEHPAKRTIIPGRAAPGYTGFKPVSDADCCTRLPVPALSIITNQESGHAGPYPPPSNPYHPPASSATPAGVPLPLPQPCLRAVQGYHQSGSQVAPQPTSATVGPVGPAGVPGTGYAGASFPPFHYKPPSRLRSPSSLAAYAMSPVVEPLHAQPNSAVHTPIAHTPISQSPSVYLQQRASPYRPIHHVNRLLYPPPSASLDQYHLAVPVQPVQMHYQPLGRPNDLRTGIVPEFMVYNGGLPCPVSAPSESQGPQGSLAP